MRPACDPLHPRWFRQPGWLSATVGRMPERGRWAGAKCREGHGWPRGPEGQEANAPKAMDGQERPTASLGCEVQRMPSMSESDRGAEVRLLRQSRAVPSSAGGGRWPQAGRGFRTSNSTAARRQHKRRAFDLPAIALRVLSPAGGGKVSERVDETCDSTNHVPRGFARAVAFADHGSSGHGCRG